MQQMLLPFCSGVALAVEDGPCFVCACMAGHEARNCFCKQLNIDVNASSGCKDFGDTIHFQPALTDNKFE